MSDFFAFENGEIGVAGFGGDEGFFDGVGGLFEGVGVFGANVDLLDLKRVVDFIKGGSGDEKGIVEVDVVEVDGVVDFGEDADDNEALA